MAAHRGPRHCDPLLVAVVGWPESNYRHGALGGIRFGDVGASSRVASVPARSVDYFGRLQNMFAANDIVAHDSTICSPAQQCQSGNAQCSVMCSFRLLQREGEAAVRRHWC
jgi:hypothetical protein